jgi:protein-disulfide isomerase
MRIALRIGIAYGALAALTAAGCTTERASARHGDRAQSSQEIVPAPQHASKTDSKVAFSSSSAAPVASQSPAEASHGAPKFDPTVYRVDVEPSDPQKGPTDALVTIVMFGNFEDKFCARAAPTMDALLRKYGDDLRLVFKHRPLPLHPNSRVAANFATEAFAQGGSALFWQAHDLLLANQHALRIQALERYGKQLGLDARRLRSALRSNAHQAKIDRDIAQSNRISEIPTSPQFTVNGRYLKGAQRQALFEKLIDEELAKAESKIAKGTPRAKVYELTVEQGALAPVEPPAGRIGGPAKPVHVAVPDGAPARGGEHATVVIQEFCDFECPFCARVQPTLRQISEQYGDRIKLVWRNYSLPEHVQGGVAAHAAMEVFAQGGHDKFWQYHDLLFADQRALSVADLERTATAIGGIDVSALRTALTDQQHVGVLTADRSAFEQTAARPATPTFLINGKVLQGALPLEVFQSAIDRALRAP